MPGRIRPRLTYANVTATLALFIALGGGAYAAIDLVGRNDIKSRHIAPNQVRAADTSDRLRLECPGGTVFVEGACLEKGQRSADDHTAAHFACVAIGRRLPSVAELLSGRLEPGITLALGTNDSYEWTHDGSGNAPAEFSVVGETGQHTSYLQSAEHTYRCVAPPKR